MNYKIVGSTAAAFVLNLILIIACFFISENIQERSINISVLVLGLALGWLIGVLATPYKGKEEDRFIGYKQAISAFLGGYIISKADNTLAQILSWETLQDPVAGFRVIAFSASFLLAMLLTYVYRAYARVNLASA